MVCCCRSGHWIESFHFTSLRYLEKRADRLLGKGGNHTTTAQHPILFQRGEKKEKKPKNVIKGAFHPPPLPKKAGRTLSSPSIACSRFQISLLHRVSVSDAADCGVSLGFVSAAGCDGATDPPRPERTRLARHGNNNNVHLSCAHHVHLSCAHQRPERSHDTY